MVSGGATSVRRGPATAGYAIAAGIVVLLILLPTSSEDSSAVVRPTADASSDLGPTPGGVNASLSIDPADWWMEGGSRANFTAAWTSVPPGCTADPLWFAWSASTSEPLGRVVSADGANATFEAAGTLSGSTAVAVHGAAQIACPTETSDAFAEASAIVRVDAPLALQGLGTVVDLAGGEPSVTVDGSILGGNPPYTVVVGWGDGKYSTSTEPDAGPFSVVGVPEVLPFVPTAMVTDADGLTAAATADENGTASQGFVIVVTPSTDTAEVGVPVEFQLTSSLPPSDYTPISVCEDAAATPSRPPHPSSDAFSCAFAHPGVANVSILAEEEIFPFTTAYCQILEPVEPDLGLTANASTESGEVGRPVLVPLTVSGGVPPFSLSWHGIGNDSAGSRTIPMDGSVLVPFNATQSGSEAIVAEVTDALGLRVTNLTVPVDVQPPLSGSASATSTVSANGTRVDVAGSVEGGVPPYSWVLLAASTSGDEPPPAGSLSVAGSFGWNSTALAGGLRGLQLVVVDAVGAVWSSNLSTDEAGPLRVSLAAVADGSGRWSGTVVVSGGAPPCHAWINASDGETWNRSGLPDGGWTVTGRVVVATNLTISVEVVDRLGSEDAARISVAVAGPPSPTTTSVALLAAPVLIACGAAVLLWRWRRRRACPVAPLPDAVGVLRGIIAPTDGTDRSVVELLAEEQGIPPATVRSELDRLIADGTVRAESGPEGEQILAWGPEA